MHLLPHREQGDAHARGDEKYWGDEPEPVGDRVGDNRGADECDDHVNGHEAAGLPSCTESELTAAGPEERLSSSGAQPGSPQDRAWDSLQTLPSAPLEILDSRASPLLTSGEVSRRGSSAGGPGSGVGAQQTSALTNETPEVFESATKAWKGAEPTRRNRMIQRFFTRAGDAKNSLSPICTSLWIILIVQRTKIQHTCISVVQILVVKMVFHVRLAYRPMDIRQPHDPIAR